MRLIVAELEAFSHYVSREFACIMRELIAVHGWKFLAASSLATGSETLRQAIVRSLGEFPEVILFWGGEHFLCSREQQVRALPGAKWFVADDLHHSGLRARQERAFLICDTILCTYAYRFAHFFPEVARIRRIVWLPHSASPDFDFAFNPEARNELFLSGAINKSYPLRTRLKTLMEEGFPGIVRQVHPGYHCGYLYHSDGRVGRGFAARMWKYRAAFTDCLVHGYAVAKHFEIPAVGSLLVADAAIQAPLALLGFSPGVHYFPVADGDLEDRLRFLLREENHPALDEIRKNGQALVLGRHRTTHRASLIAELPLTH